MSRLTSIRLTRAAKRIRAWIKEPRGHAEAVQGSKATGKMAERSRPEMLPHVTHGNSASRGCTKAVCEEIMVKNFS